MVDANVVLKAFLPEEHSESARIASGVLDYPSRWLLLSRDAAFLALPEVRARASPPSVHQARPWTDAWSNLLDALKR